jgi:hypothetical protein
MLLIYRGIGALRFRRVDGAWNPEREVAVVATVPQYGDFER